MRKLIYLLLTALIAGTAYADTCATTLIPAFTANQATQLCSKYGPSQATSIIPQAGATINIGGVASPIANINTAQLGFPLPAVLTPQTSYPTPASATILTARIGIIAAAAPTAAYITLPQATGIPATAQDRILLSLSANPVALVPYPGDTINSAAAATPYACAAGKKCVCTKTGAASWYCDQ